MKIATKTQAKEIFGTFQAIAKALGITKGAISQWPEDLPQSIQDRLLGAAYREGLIK